MHSTQASIIDGGVRVASLFSRWREKGPPSGGDGGFNSVDVPGRSSPRRVLRIAASTPPEQQGPGTAKQKNTRWLRDFWPGLVERNGIEFADRVRIRIEGPLVGRVEDTRFIAAGSDRGDQNFAEQIAHDAGSVGQAVDRVAVGHDQIVKAGAGLSQWSVLFNFAALFGREVCHYNPILVHAQQILFLDRE